MAGWVSVRELVEGEDRWVLPLEGGTVVQCRVDYAFTLVVEANAASYEVRIEQPFELCTNGGRRRLTWHEDPVALAPALAVLHARVAEALAVKDGRFEIRFRDGRRLEVPANADFEAWTLVGPGGLQLVSMPGGELAVWSAEGQG